MIFGRGELPKTIDIAAGEANVTIYGAGAGDGLGMRVARGDINGDGVEDLVLGASSEE